MLSAILCILVVTVVVYLGFSHKRPRQDSIPGPPFLRGLSTLFSALIRNNLYQVAENWAGQYGDLVEVNMGLGRLVFVNSPDLARLLLCDPRYRDVTNDRPSTYMGQHTLFNGTYQDIMLANFSSAFVKRRKFFHAALKMYGHGVEAFESLVQQTSSELTFRLENYPGNVPLKKELTAYICHMVGLLLKGKNLRDTDLKVLVSWIDAGNECIRFENETILRLFPFARFTPGLRIKTLIEELNVCHKELSQAFFHDARESYLRGEKSGFIGELLEQQGKLREEGQGEELSDHVIMGLVVDIMSASFISTDSTICGLFLHLIRDHTIQDRIHKEIQTVIGDNPPGFEHRRHMPYTDAAILETLRFSSIAPLLVPHRTSSDVSIDGRVISRGSTVLVNAWHIHHRPDLWHQPWTFRPERFLDSRGQLLDPEHPDRQKLLVFGTGPRACPGENFARSRVFLVLVTLLQRFRFMPPVDDVLPSSHPRDWKLGSVFSPHNFQCRMELRPGAGPSHVSQVK
ncbi:farnesoate epoxidase-like [Aplysia californica]|uniref:Farnesoate epoxidase-like n=1 Tax=Aplysia californica TaxID=6500 RepID=A0ABM0JR26_APLCA|nr:farnesoate epoxidase-like [Aplysia californica]